MEEAAGFASSCAIQKPCAKTKCSKQQILSSKATEEWKSKVNSFGYPPTSGFQLICSKDSNRRSTKEFPSKKSFIIDWQSTRALQTDMPLPPGAKTINAKSQNANEIKRASDTPRYITFNRTKVAGAAANEANTGVTNVNWQQNVGTMHKFAPTVPATLTTAGNHSNVPAATAQLTIFYAGEVNVYNIPPDKAHEIMSLANQSNLVSNSTNMMRQQVQFLDPAAVRAVNIYQSPNNPNKEPGGKEPPSPVSVTSHFIGGFIRPGNIIGENIIDLTATGVFHGPNIITALPMARKASLARFLEKRKERLANTAPYISPQKSLPNTMPIDVSDVSNAPDESEATLAAFASSQEQPFTGSLSFGEPKSPNTKLEL